MPERDELFIRRLRELSGRGGGYRYLGFLDEAQGALTQAMARSGSLRDLSLWGGYPGAERLMARFGSPGDLGYEEPWPIARLILRPAAGRFSEELAHRDVLGALMSLGIEREVLGDQVFSGGVWHVFCREEMAPHLATLSSVRNTPVRISRAEEGLPEPVRQTETLRVNVPSPRADAVVAHLAGLSRGKAAEMFPRQLIKVNALVCEDPSRLLKEGDVFSVRGVGKFRCGGVAGTSKKGRLYLEVFRFV